MPVLNALYDVMMVCVFPFCEVLALFIVLTTKL